jgi:predicted phosphoribosyltransferase
VSVLLSIYWKLFFSSLLYLLTPQVAIKVARGKRARRVIVAVPVLPADRVNFFEQQCDEFVYLMAPMNFMCVSQYYAHFPQLSHGDVIDILEKFQLMKESEMKQRET